MMELGRDTKLSVILRNGYHGSTVSPHTDDKKKVHSSRFNSVRSSSRSRALLGQPPRASSPRATTWAPLGKYHTGNPGAVEGNFKLKLIRLGQPDTLSSLCLGVIQQCVVIHTVFSAV